MKKLLVILLLPFYVACQSEAATENSEQAPTEENSHDHEGHDHDHEGHDHGHDHEGHDHGHDHEGHDHSGHDHGDQKPGHYGNEITPNDAIDIDKMVAMLGDKEELDCKIKAEVITSCKKKGCWMDVKMANGETMKVTFKDYGFFVPTDGLMGKTAYMQGKAMRSVTDVATLQHYAEDAGKSQDEIDAITEPEEAVRFEATGVIIED